MAQTELDAIDRCILEILQRNARIANTDLADEVGIATPSKGHRKNPYGANRTQQGP